MIQFMQSLVLIARKMKCMCRYYQCKMLFCDSKVAQLQELAGTVLRRVTIREVTAILTVIRTFRLFACKRVLYASKNFYFIDIVNWISYSEIKATFKIES